MTITCNVMLEHVWRGGGDAQPPPAGAPTLSSGKVFVSVLDSGLVWQEREVTLAGEPMLTSRVRVRLSAPLLDDLILARDSAMTEPGERSGRVQEGLRHAIEAVLLYALKVEGMPAGWRLEHAGVETWNREAGRG